MAETPPNITITVDEGALRAQVQRVITEEVKVAAMALRRAADALDPDWMAEHNAWMEQHHRAKWEAEREPGAAGREDER